MEARRQKEEQVAERKRLEKQRLAEEADATAKLRIFEAANRRDEELRKEEEKKREAILRKEEEKRAAEAKKLEEQRIADEMARKIATEEERKRKQDDELNRLSDLIAKKNDEENRAAKEWENKALITKMVEQQEPAQKAMVLFSNALNHFNQSLKQAGVLEESFEKGWLKSTLNNNQKKSVAYLEQYYPNIKSESETLLAAYRKLERAYQGLKPMEITVENLNELIKDIGASLNNGKKLIELTHKNIYEVNDYLSAEEKPLVKSAFIISAPRNPLFTQLDYLKTYLEKLLEQLADIEKSLIVYGTELTKNRDWKEQISHETVD